MTRDLVDSKITDETAFAEPSEPQRRRSIGRLGGMLFVAGALLSTLSALTLDSQPRPWILVILALAGLTGIVSFLLPWDRFSPRWLHAMPVIATLEITVGLRNAGAGGDVYAWLYLMVVVMVAYAFRERKIFAAYVGFVSLCLASLLVDPARDAGGSLRDLVVAAPTLAIAAAVVTYFRERLEAGKHAYQALSRLDPLTGVGNYRTLYERLDYELARHERHGRELTVMLLDLRGFKQVNEAYGHLEGDRVLRAVGQALAGAMRHEDTLARQGGDEFSVLAPETTSDEAAALAERLRQALSTVPMGDDVLTASVGWAIYPEHGSTTQELLAHADTALLGDKSRLPARAPRSPLAAAVR
jgi:diguanylate cyclase (GGDEF)-like protein